MAWNARRGEVVLLENVRFNKGEKKDKEDLARRMAALCDVFVMDAFGTAHRAEASTHGVARFAKVACAGPLLMNELVALETALDKPKRPLIAIVAGSKVSTKLTVLESLLQQGRQADRRRRHRQHLPRARRAIGVGKSLVEAEMIDIAQGLLEALGGVEGGDSAADRRGRRQGVLGQRRSRRRSRSPRSRADEMILDIGPDTAERFARCCCTTPARSSGTGRSACSSSINSAKARARWRRRSRGARRFPSPAAATRWRRSRSIVSRTTSPTSPPAAALSWSSSKARSCPAVAVLEERSGS